MHFVDTLKFNVRESDASRYEGAICGSAGNRSSTDTATTQKESGGYVLDQLAMKFFQR